MVVSIFGAALFLACGDLGGILGLRVGDRPMFGLFRRCYAVENRLFGPVLGSVRIQRAGLICAVDGFPSIPTAAFDTENLDGRLLGPARIGLFV